MQSSLRWKEAFIGVVPARIGVSAICGIFYHVSVILSVIMAGPETNSAKNSNAVFTRKLASTDKKSRDKGVALLSLWLTSQEKVDEESLKKVWKGLFYCVWHSDKAQVQGELIESLAGLLEKADTDVAITFFKVFLSTMRREWVGIDKLRLDKFYLLLRKFLAYVFKVLDSRDWDQALTARFMEALEERTLLATDRFPALGINLHFIDIYWDEFRKFLPASRGVLEVLLRPFYTILSKSTDKLLLKRVRENIFDPLVEDGRRFSQDIESEESDRKARTLGYLLHSTPIVSRLFDLASSTSIPQANRKLLYELHEEFSKVCKVLNAIDASVYDSYFQKNESKSLGNIEGRVVAEEVTEDGVRMSDGRLKRRQARAKALGVKDPVTFKSKSRSKKIPKKKRHEELNVVENGGQNEFHVDDEEAGVGDQAHANENLNGEGAVVTIGMNLPLLQKRLAKKKEKGKKRKIVNLEAAMGTNGSAPGEDEVIAQAATSPVGINGSGQQGINDVTMNLEKQFDCVAAEDHGKVSMSPDSVQSLSPPFGTRSKRKRKKEKTAAELLTKAQDSPNDLENGDGAAAAKSDDGTEVSVKKSKKVRFSLKNNIVWKPQGPLPPLSVRTPPSATPRGSALKVGVQPGPIRTRPIRATRGNGMRSRKRVSKQYISVTSAKPSRSSPRKVKR
ncbi:hypothetical protein R1sor_006706 [Riccia sorocarpa]|uniref:Ribosomal RNA processing protein 1 n=1 Tax=Riccia sorocarpa TaxID=122646 RepID=A0ABD3HS08_9MARC